MSLSKKVLWLLGALALMGPPLQTQVSDRAKIQMRLDRPNALELHNVRAEPVTYRGQNAIRLVDDAPGGGDDVSRIAVVNGTSIKDGHVEITLSGDTAADASPQLRGFVGIAFRVAGNASHYECFYLRPKNGRSEDQLQRNHSAQYISVPGFPWNKLRDESPGKYESYVDLVPGAWTKIKVEFAGTTARLYVNGSGQPTLIVHDLKQPSEAGALALWIGPGTIANFSDLSFGR